MSEREKPLAASIGDILKQKELDEAAKDKKEMQVVQETLQERIRHVPAPLFKGKGQFQRQPRNKNDERDSIARQQEAHLMADLEEVKSNNGNEVQRKQTASAFIPREDYRDRVMNDLWCKEQEVDNKLKLANLIWAKKEYSETLRERMIAHVFGDASYMPTESVSREGMRLLVKGVIITLSVGATIALASFVVWAFSPALPAAAPVQPAM